MKPKKRTKRQKRGIAFCLLGSSVLMFGFMNCSKSGFQVQSLDSINQSSSAAPGPDDDTPAADSSLVPVLMAQGTMGRTVMSCDDGKTWINDRSDDDLARCGVRNDPHFVECDHNSSAGRGLAAAEVGFFANFGWGYPGTVRATTDGKNWNSLLKDEKTFSGNMLSYVEGMLIVFTQYWSLSADQGRTWSSLPESQRPAAANYTHAYNVGDKFILTSREGIIAVGSKDGMNWFSPASFNPTWGMNTERGSRGGFVMGNNGVLVGLGYTTDSNSVSSNYASISTDGGKTWTGNLIFQEQYASWSTLLFTGTEFVAWAGTKMWRSPDGINWSSTPILSGASPRIRNAAFNGPVAITPQGTFVSISSDNGDYDYQFVTRSSDGVHWTRLANTQFKGGHPVEYLLNGFLPAKACGKKRADLPVPVET